MPIALLLALVASLGIHAAVLLVPDLELAALLESPPLRAELIIVPPAEKKAEVAAFPVLAKAPAKPVKPAAKHLPHRPLTAGESASPARAVPPEPPSAGATVAAEAAAPARASDSGAAASPPAVRQRYLGRIRFIVYKGEQGMEVGQEIHQWEMADGAYRLTGTLETTGLAAVFKPLRIVKDSRGRVDGEGLHPEHFVVTRNGKETGERADFDLTAGTVSVAGRAAQAFAAGSQDLMSFHYQLALLQPAGRLDIGLATGKKYARYHFELVGEETLATPAGSFRTRHYRASDDSVTEVWLAVDRAGVPVKIRHTDRNGDVFDEVAAEVSLDVVSESPKAP